MLTENREFNEIYEQYKNLILKAAYTYSGSYSAAEDITQDTFLKLYMGCLLYTSPSPRDTR